MLEFLEYGFTDLSLALTIVAGIVLLFYVFYYVVVYGMMLRFFRKERKHPSTPPTQNLKGVSVVVVTNNNGDALRDRLIQILEQEYPLFEVIVVNENSKDDTEFVLYVLKQNYQNLTVINLGENANKFESSKFSTSIGVRSAKYDNVILTDVFCEPKSYNWLSEMMAPINSNSNKKIVTGISLREKSKGLANVLEKYDEATSYMNLICHTLIGNVYSSCGENMCYNKDFFLKNGGFISQYASSCKQEDYFVHRFANKKNTSIVLNKDSFVYLPPYTKYKDFRRIKFAASISKKALYAKDKILLALPLLSSFVFYLLCVALLLIHFPWQYIVAAIVIKWIIQTIYYKKCMSCLEIKKYWLYTPILEIYFMFFNFFIRTRVLFFKKRKTKIKWE